MERSKIKSMLVEVIVDVVMLFLFYNVPCLILFFVFKYNERPDWTYLLLCLSFGFLYGFDLARHLDKTISKYES